MLCCLVCCRGGQKGREGQEHCCKGEQLEWPAYMCNLQKGKGKKDFQNASATHPRIGLLPKGKENTSIPTRRQEETRRDETRREEKRGGGVSNSRKKVGLSKTRGKREEKKESGQGFGNKGRRDDDRKEHQASTTTQVSQSLTHPHSQSVRRVTFYLRM